MTTNEILIGLGLIVVLAIGSRLVAERLRIPVIVLLLPVGFIAGALTSDVNPQKLFGETYQPLVSLGVGLILFEAGLRLRLRDTSELRSVVIRLISLGTILTFAAITLAVKLIFGLGTGTSAMLGAILVVSGPTVVLPLLEFVRPSERVRSALKWEGVLIDPIGALLGVVIFSIVSAGGIEQAFRPGELMLSLSVGAAIGLAGAAFLWLLLGDIQRTSPKNGAPAALMVVLGAVVLADLIREDSGFVAATVMGAVLANQSKLDVARILEFHGTLVSLLIGMLFVMISASVEPSQVEAILPEGLALIAVMVLVIRPAVIVVSTVRSTLSWRERAFMAWMAPRGIVAAATASAFGLELVQAGTPGADKILPIAFLVIFGTVLIYGLSATPVARMLGVAGAGAPVVLIVGGHPWARRIAAALVSAGAEVRLISRQNEERAAADSAGIELAGADLATAGNLEEELEDVSAALMITDSDDFNALAANRLRQELGTGQVFRLAPGENDLEFAPAYAEGGVLFDSSLTFAELERRFAAGAELIESEQLPSGDGSLPLFLVGGDSGIEVVTAGAAVEGLGAGVKAVLLAAGPGPGVDASR